MDAGVDASMYLRSLYGEVLLVEFSAAVAREPPPELLPLKAITDCRSLYDLLTKEGTPSTTLERRLSIDIAALAQIGEGFDFEEPKKTFLWCPTTVQIADHLTKIKPAFLLRDILNRGWICLKDTT